MLERAAWWGLDLLCFNALDALDRADAEVRRAAHPRSPSGGAFAESSSPSIEEVIVKHQELRKRGSAERLGHGWLGLHQQVEAPIVADRCQPLPNVGHLVYLDTLDAVSASQGICVVFLSFMAGLGCINKLQHLLLLTAANLFRDTPLTRLWGLHEFHQNVGHLVYLDTLDAVSAFKSQGVFVVSLSYLWLSWSQAGTDERQHRARRLSLECVAAERGHDMGKLYIWLDILSIPQRNDTLKRLAVNSLYTYARQADALVINAPDSEHQELRQPANIQTYKLRLCRRAEQVSFFCSQGLDSKFIMTEAFVRVPADRMDDMAALFEGSMTCCTRRHAGGACCDKESLVLPMLGMYFYLCIRSTRSLRNDIPADWMDDVAALFEGSMTCCTRRHAGGACGDKESFVLPMLGMYFDLCIRSRRSSRAAHSDRVFNVIQDPKPRFFPRPTLTSRRQETWCARSSLANRQLSWIASSSRNECG